MVMKAVATSRPKGTKSIGRRALGCTAVATVLVLALPLAGFLNQVIASAADARRYPPPGERIDVGGYRIHILERGTGSPTVVLDSASLDTVSGWHWIVEDVSSFTQVVAYDRPGIGWSDLGPEPRDVELNVSQLREALEEAGVEPPFVMVGHSLGGLYVRAFAGRHPEDVAGVVLIEATHPDFPARLGLPNRMPNADEGMLRMAPYAARFGLLRMMRMLPTDPNLPSQQRAEMASYYCSNNFADRTLSDFVRWPDLLAQAAAVESFGATPLCVVVGSDSENATGDPRALQDDFLHLSTDSRFVVVDGADHASLVHNRDHARVIAAEIRAMVERIRAEEASAS
jgi:pimeloyl-ACP methyl ester carboxylesterase